jgi:hypothetical protein
MMNFSKEDEERFRGSVDVLSEGFDVNLHCSEENMKIYESKEKKDKETFDKIKDFCKEKLPLVVSKYPCVKDFLNRMDEFTPDTSFFRILLKKGNELNK